MPEIKHTFSAGKMDKDLDERLVPNGQYRDALNIRVSTSDASDVGAVCNILGNQSIDPIISDFAANAKCVGAIADEKNDCFYWFVQNDGVSDLILKYSEENGVQPVLVDLFTTGGVLKFERKIITGINIIDDLLFWTDNINEPRKINIKNCMIGTPNFTTHTKLNNPITNSLLNGFSDSNVFIKEEHITVIKRAPYKAPTMSLVSDFSFNQPGVIRRDQFASADGSTLWSVGNYPDSGSTNNSTGAADINLRIFNSSTTNDYTVNVGTIIQVKSVEINNIGIDIDNDNLVDELYQNFNQAYSYGTDYDVRMKITSVSSYQAQSQTLTPGLALSGWIDVHAEILNIDSSTTRLPSTWVVKFERESETLFENKFPRFAYRYKFLDGEYSPFSPFTEVAFNAGTYSQDAVRGYNLGMKNDIKEVILSEFVTVDLVTNVIRSKKIPHDVIGIDLLYKESDSPNVYVVESLSPVDIAWSDAPPGFLGAYGSGKYSITAETIYKAVASNQLLRSFDSVPKKALAQEVVGNRLVYANYEQNLDIWDDDSFNQYQSIDLDFSYDQYFADVSDEKGVPSVKSLRSYQLGVVFEDKYGRQTPVLTNKDSVLNIPITQSSIPTRFTCKLSSDLPSEATNYKFFIKETSSEYYNLPLAKWYDAQDGNIWLSFISADRNKIDEEDYLYLKKEHNTDSSVDDPNKYKVLAISNEAPDFIKTDRQTLGKLTHSTSNIVFSSPSSMPLENRFEFRISEQSIIGTGYANIEEKENLKMTLFNDNGERSETYKITNVVKDNTATDFVVTIDERFGTDVNFIKSSSFTPTVPDIADGVFIEITYGVVENQPEFDGKFFVKIYRDFNINKLVLNYKASAAKKTTIHQQQLYYYTASDDDLPCLDNGGIAPVFDSGSLRWSGGNNWLFDIYDGPYRDSNNSYYAWQNGRADAIPFFGDGSTFDTSLPLGPKWFIDAMPYERTRDNDSNPSNPINAPGTNTGITGNTIDISFSGIELTDGQDYNDIYAGYGWEVGVPSNPNTDQEFAMVENLNTGKQFYFSEDVDQTIYTITNVVVSKQYNIIDRQAVDLSSFAQPLVQALVDATFEDGRNRRKRWRLTLDKQIGFNNTYNPVTASSNAVSQTNPTGISFVEDLDARDTKVKIAKNPAVFETKPKNNNNLEIYHAASESYDASFQVNNFDHELRWSNCFTFGNGVESNRIQDDFNASFIDNGPFVSAVFEGDYKKETISNRLIYSGIYNSKNSFNRINEFISAEKITKDVNPTYGSIQKLYTRDSDLIVFCEDKVLKILANKDALFNADGNPQLIANNNVLGQVMPFAGNYGISKDPESFATESFRTYFTDRQRGAVLRLSRDGLTPISSYGMTDYFKDNLKDADELLGSYDARNNEYNISIKQDLNKLEGVTISFDESVNGWSSFKSFVPDFALSSSNVYYSFEHAYPFQHDLGLYNNFYNRQFGSSINVLLNDISGIVKNYKTINYEGTQAKINEEITDVRTGYYNLNQKPGWFVGSITTDLDDGKVPEFIEKEGKWFNYIKGQNNII